MSRKYLRIKRAFGFTYDSDNANSDNANSEMHEFDFVGQYKNVTIPDRFNRVVLLTDTDNVVFIVPTTEQTLSMGLKDSYGVANWSKVFNIGESKLDESALTRLISIIGNYPTWETLAIPKNTPINFSLKLSQRKLFNKVLNSFDTGLTDNQILFGIVSVIGIMPFLTDFDTFVHRARVNKNPQNMINVRNFVSVATTNEKIPTFNEQEDFNTFEQMVQKFSNDNVHADDLINAISRTDIEEKRINYVFKLNTFEKFSHMHANELVRMSPFIHESESQHIQETVINRRMNGLILHIPHEVTLSSYLTTQEIKTSNNYDNLAVLLDSVFKIDRTKPFFSSRNEIYYNYRKQRQFYSYMAYIIITGIQNGTMENVRQIVDVCLSGETRTSRIVKLIASQKLQTALIEYVNEQHNGLDLNLYLSIVNTPWGDTRSFNDQEPLLKFV